MKLTESTHIVRFPDCDPFNHLNNARYIDYFINAREDHEIEFFGFNTYEYAQKTGRSWVIGQNQIAYFSPAFLMEKVLIQSVILEWNYSDILIEMRMWNEQKTKLKSILWTRFVHFDLKNLSKTEHTPELRLQFQENISKTHTNITFDERVLYIRKKKYEELS